MRDDWARTGAIKDTSTWEGGCHTSPMTSLSLQFYGKGGQTIPFSLQLMQETFLALKNLISPSKFFSAPVGKRRYVSAINTENCLLRCHCLLVAHCVHGIWWKEVTECCRSLSGVLFVVPKCLGSTYKTSTFSILLAYCPNLRRSWN